MRREMKGEEEEEIKRWRQLEVETVVPFVQARREHTLLVDSSVLL